MTQQLITNTPFNSGQGDRLAVAFGKVNANFTEVYGLTSNTVTQVFYPTAATDAAIRVAALAANANGGGTVKLPATTINILSPLPMYNGVLYEGTGFSAAQLQVGDTEVTGTILVGNGTFDCFAYNATNLHATPPASRTAFMAGMVAGGGVRGLAIQNFAYGVHIGDYYNPGCQGCVFEDLLITQCSQWGFWIENFEWIRCNRILISVGNGVGGGSFTNSSNGLNNGGDSVLEFLWTDVSASTAYGWVFQQRGAGADSLNNIKVGYISTSRGTITATSQACTTNGTTSIAVTDSTKFAPGMPVCFSAAPPGINATAAATSNSTNTVYYVTRIINSTHIAIATTVQDPFQTLTEVSPGAGSGTIQTWGMTQLAIQCTGTAVPSAAIQPISIGHLTMEGSGTVLMHVQYTQAVNIDGVDILSGVQGTNSYRAASLRSASNVNIRGWGSGSSAFVSDIDNASNNFITNAPSPSNYSGPVTGAPIGAQGIRALGSDASGRLSVSPPYQAVFLTGNAPDIAVNKNNIIEFPNQTLGQAATFFTDGSTIQWWGFFTRTNHWVYIGAGGAGGTLQTIQANGEGVWLWLINSTANSMIINSDGTQKIYNSDLAGLRTATTFTVAAGKHALIMASYNNGGTGTTTNYFWARLL